MNTIDQPTTDARPFPHPCPVWCTVNHRHPLAQQEEQQDGERVHGVCVGRVGEASVWVNRVDTRDPFRVSLASVWAEAEGAYFDTAESIRYAELVMQAVAIVKESRA